MAKHDTYDAEQMDRIRRVGKEMQSVAPITSRSLPSIDSKMNHGPVTGGEIKVDRKKIKTNK